MINSLLVLNWEIITGISSVIIATCALGVTIWHGIQTRRHNRLSVLPHLASWKHFEGSKNHYSVELSNNGVGPALIKTFKIEVDGKPIIGEDSEPIEKALKILFPRLKYDAKHAALSKGYMMTAKEKIQIVDIIFFGDNVPKPEEVNHAIKRTRLAVSYESIHGESFKFDSNDFMPQY